MSLFAYTVITLLKYIGDNFMVRIFEKKTHTFNLTSH